MSNITNGWLEMSHNYDDRKIGNDYVGKVRVSTAGVPDGTQPYETAVCHPEYDNGEMIIVEAYDTKEQAKKGHPKWIRKMTSKKLPTKLVDCQNSYISKLCGPLEFKRNSGVKK